MLDLGKQPNPVAGSLSKKPMTEPLKFKPTKNLLSKAILGLSAALASALINLPTEAGAGLHPQLNFSAASKGPRVLRFPEKFSLGEISIATGPYQPDDQRLRGAAKGTIKVPAHRFVSFVPAHRFYQDPGTIKNLPADGIDNIWLSASSFADSEDGLSDRAMSYVGHLKGLIVLNLDKSDISDKGAMYAGDLPNLQQISAFATMIEGKFFSRLAGHKKLQALMLNWSPVKDSNLVYLSALPALEYLSLGNTSISDAGIRSIAQCRNLITLDLGGNHKITNKNLHELLKLKKLRMLIISNTAATFDGVMALKDLPLTYLGLPGQNYTPEQMKALHRAFPLALIVPNSNNQKKVNQDQAVIFAPLH